MAESINLKSFQMYTRLFLDQDDESWYYHEDNSWHRAAYFIQDDQKDVLLLIVKSCWSNVSVTSLTGLGPTIVGEEIPIYPNYSKGPIWSKDSIHTPTKIRGVNDMKGVKNDGTSWLFSNRTKYSLCWNIQLNLFIGESVQNRAGNTKSSCMQ